MSYRTYKQREDLRENAAIGLKRAYDAEQLVDTTGVPDALWPIFKALRQAVEDVFAYARAVEASMLDNDRE